MIYLTRTYHFAILQLISKIAHPQVANTLGKIELLAASLPQPHVRVEMKK